MMDDKSILLGFAIGMVVSALVCTACIYYWTKPNDEFVKAYIQDYDYTHNIETKPKYIGGSIVQLKSDQ